MALVGEMTPEAAAEMQAQLASSGKVEQDVQVTGATDDTAITNIGMDSLPKGQSKAEESTDKGSNTERPEWLPEKFATVEDLAKAYGELESKLGGKDTPIPTKTGIENPDVGSKTDEIVDADKDTKPAEKVDMVAVETEYATNGSLTEDTYAKLAGFGIPKEVVDTYIAATEKNVQSYNASLFEIAGSEQEYAAMTAWAAENKDAAYIKDFDSVVTSGKQPSISKALVKDLYQEFISKAGNKAPLVHGGGKPSSSGAKPYANNGEFMVDITNPLYKNRSHLGDTFRKQVEARLAAGTSG